MLPRERLFALEHFGIKLGLDNITTLLEVMHRPDRAFATIHIAGTNGKGSVTAMVERGLRAAGHKTGRYTSPHLADIEERVAIDGRPVDGALFDEVAAEVLATIDRLISRGVLQHSPTFFEATTAIAFEVFRRQHVTAGVIEVGLGGRFDATNVIAPILTAITSIALDHERHLGTTLAEIAFEKAGIIKTGVPVVVGPVPPEAMEVIGQAATRQRAPVFTAAPDARGTAVPLALPGVHQQNNAAVAVELLRLCPDAGLEVSREDIVTALTDVEWPARLEWLRLPSAHEVLIDAAHNPAGAAALADYVQDATGPLPLVLGVMKDKNIDAIVRVLSPATARVVATQVDSPRALDARLLADRVRELTPTLPVDWREDPDDAVALALEHGQRVMIAGSIFLVGPLRSRLIAAGAARVRYPSKASAFYLV
jgi:dihydrofolate synthase/folylpolyglutamate synthase